MHDQNRRTTSRVASPAFDTGPRKMQQVPFSRGPDTGVVRSVCSAALIWPGCFLAWDARPPWGPSGCHSGTCPCAPRVGFLVSGVPCVLQLGSVSEPSVGFWMEKLFPGRAMPPQLARRTCDCSRGRRAILIVSPRDLGF